MDRIEDDSKRCVRLIRCEQKIFFCQRVSKDFYAIFACTNVSVILILKNILEI